MTVIQLLATIACFTLLMVVVKKTNVKYALVSSTMQHRIFASLIGMCVLWSFHTQLHPGLDINFLGLSAVTLILGFRWAVIVSTVAFLLTHWFMAYDVQLFAIKLLLANYLPIGVCYAIYTWSFHRLPKNPFIYIFVCGFLAGAISIALKILLLSIYYTVDGLYAWQLVMDNYVIITPLLLFPEAMFNGVIITMLLVYAPHWLYTYHDKFYFNE